MNGGHRSSLVVFLPKRMGYKTTTDIFVLRGETNATITGTSGSAVSEIETSLDTLNREVLLVWEVDIQNGTIPIAAADSLSNAAALETLEIHNAVATEDGNFQLNDSEYVAGSNVSYFGKAPATFGTAVERNPDSRDFASQGMQPLAILTAQSIHLRTGFSSSIAFGTSDTYLTRFRLHCQRAKADADTYAALVTGLI